jgi:hypothetical protein
MCPGTRDAPSARNSCPANGIERALTATMRIIVVSLTLVLSLVACALVKSAPEAPTAIGQGSYAEPLDIPHASALLARVAGR